MAKRSRDETDVRRGHVGVGWSGDRDGYGPSYFGRKYPKTPTTRHEMQLFQKMTKWTSAVVDTTRFSKQKKTVVDTTRCSGYQKGLNESLFHSLTSVKMINTRMSRSVMMQNYDQRITGDVERARVHHTR